MLGLGIGVGAMILLYYYVASYQQDLIYLLGTSVDRLFMPCWILVFLGFFQMVNRASSDEVRR
jgi:hypothetical protein